jgi:hypothetical protein
MANDRGDERMIARRTPANKSAKRHARSIKRRTPLKRSQKPIVKRRAKPRRGPMRSPEYRAWLKTKRCCVCPAMSSDPAHTENNGMRSKGPDSSCAPLCRQHHEEYDRGRKAFEVKYDVDMKQAAKAFWFLFLER